MTNDKMTVPCAVCRDLAPLVADHVASPESEALVRAHLAACPACAAEWPDLCGAAGTDPGPSPEAAPAPALPDDIRVLRRLQRRLSQRTAVLLAVGALGGTLLTYSSHSNLVILFFPLVCGVLSWQRDPAWRVLPVLTFVCTTLMTLLLNTPQYTGASVWAAVRAGLWLGVISAVLCVIGALAGHLLAYAFQKEEEA